MKEINDINSLRVQLFSHSYINQFVDINDSNFLAKKITDDIYLVIMHDIGNSVQ
jgi:hypothetical protein